MDLRFNRELSTGIASGVRYAFEKDNLQLLTALRYYSEEFNFGYNGEKPRYYGFNDSYIGTQLYPLKNFYRNLSQWALYTHSDSTDLLTFELSRAYKRKVYKKLFIHCDVDLNYIYKSKERSGDIYPIYSSGIQVDFLPVFRGRISATNKHMELRNFYQTSSISRAPFLAFSFLFKIEEIPLKTVYLKPGAKKV